jgi:hypothetical protein
MKTNACEELDKTVKQANAKYLSLLSKKPEVMSLDEFHGYLHSDEKDNKVSDTKKYQKLLNKIKKLKDERAKLDECIDELAVELYLMLAKD